ncbi:putative transcriptional regulator [Methanocella sp. MCL-LM]|uniref:putative transcriptional regulator n=1 Tax=Methanocella sp. MCL-LM TaxID=3412035 RepID=UPI003C773872
MDQIMSAIIKSMVRFKVLVFLASHPKDEFNAMEIAQRIRSSYENVIGALRGYGKRYNKALSLVSLGLATQTEKEPGISFYRITPAGIEFAERVRRDSLDNTVKLSFVCIEENGNSVIRARVEW